MLKIEEIREIIKLIDQSSIEEFVYKHEGSKVELKKRTSVEVVQGPSINTIPAAIAQPSTPPAVEVSAPQNNEQENTSQVESEQFHKIVSPMVGTFYMASSPDTLQLTLKWVQQSMKIRLFVS